jgi:hypothetical protein
MARRAIIASSSRTRLANSAFLHQPRKAGLTRISFASRLPAAQAGNLAMAVVDAVLDRLRPPELSEDVRSVRKRIREDDVWPLHQLRVVL